MSTCKGRVDKRWCPHYRPLCTDSAECSDLYLLIWREKENNRIMCTPISFQNICKGHTFCSQKMAWCTLSCERWVVGVRRWSFSLFDILKIQGKNAIFILSLSKNSLHTDLSFVCLLVKSCVFVLFYLLWVNYWVDLKYLLKKTKSGHKPRVA